MKSVAKQNEIRLRRLSRDLVKLEQVEKSGLRMIETERHRFRACHRRLEVQGEASGSNAVSVRMYETHNPGFCYHCTGAIKESGCPAKKRSRGDCYELVRSILFTNGEVDPDKLLCLHLLAAHSVNWDVHDDSSVRPVPSVLETAESKQLTGPWSNLLPCYVISLYESPNGEAGNLRLHEDPRKLSLEEEAVRELEEKYRQYAKENADFGKALTANAKKTGMAPKALGKLPIVSPQVYSLLRASRQAKRLEGRGSRKFPRSNVDLDTLDGASSFRLEGDDDTLSKTTNNVSTRHWETRSIRSPSRRSGLKLDGVTMLKGKYGKLQDQAFRFKNHETVTNELITIKSSTRIVKDAASRSSSARSAYRIPENRSSTNSLVPSTLNSESMIKRSRRIVYLSSPVKRADVNNKSYRTVPILVNYRVEALVESVLEVLERVNPEKLRGIVNIARDLELVKTMLAKSETQAFLRSLSGQPLISSAESFVVCMATATNEINFRFNVIPEQEIIALTFEAPPIPTLDALLNEIRGRIFIDSRKKIELPENCCAPNKETCDGSKQIGPMADEKMEPSGPREEPSMMMTLRSGEESEKRIDADFLEGATDPRGLCTAATRKNKEGTAVGLSNKKRIAETNSRPVGKKHSSERERQRVGPIDEHQTADTKSLRHSLNPSRRTTQDGHFDMDHAILRRMTNAQRILVGQMCASLKAKQINNEGLINERLPLAAVIAPALSRESIKALTRGTLYSKAEPTNKRREEPEEDILVLDEITGPLLAKIRQEVAEYETSRRLNSFLEKKI